MEKEKISFKELLGLAPPRAPIISEKSVLRTDTRGDNNIDKRSNILTDSKPIIEKDLNLDEMFEWCAQNSSFRRWLIEFVKKVVPGFEGKYHRFSKEEMNKVFLRKRKEVEHKLKSFDKNARNYQNVMNEFKSKLERLKND